MKICPKQIHTIAELARLELTDEKCQCFARQFEDILGHMEQLAQVDTHDVAPLFSPMEEPARMRSDTVQQNTTPAEILTNAPQTDGQYFLVPKII